MMNHKLTHFELLISFVYILTGAVIMLVIISVWQLVPKAELYISDIEKLNLLGYEWKEPHRDLSIDGNSLLIGDKWYPKGIGVHAETAFSVTLPQGYTRFIADVGVDDEVLEDSPASMVFQVIGDGTILAQSPLMKPDMPAYRIDCRIHGVTQLTLIVTNGGDTSHSDHGDWGNARVVKE